MPARLALPGTPLWPLRPAPRGSDSAPPRAARPGRFKATAAPAPLRPSRRSSLGNRLWPGTTWWPGKRLGFRASQKSSSLSGPQFFIRKLVMIPPLAG